MQCQSNSWTICMWQLMGVITDYHRILFPDWMTCNVNHKSTSKKTRVLLGCGTKSLLSSSRRRQANWRSAGGYKQKRQWCHSGGHEGRRRGDASPPTLHQPVSPTLSAPFHPFTTSSTANTMSERQLKYWTRMTLSAMTKDDTVPNLRGSLVKTAYE